MVTWQTDMWSDARVLITGGAGFIGSNLARRLVELGSSVRIADNFSRGSIQNIEPFLDKVEIHRVDLAKWENCLAAVKGVEYVFHLAASVGGIHYISKENVEGSTPSVLMNTLMLEAARMNDIERFLFTSSACVYRERSNQLNRFKEEDAFPANPQTTYGWAKILGEIQCKSYHLDYGIKSCILRIFNAYGENENLDPKSSHVIPSLIRKSLRYPSERFEIFGDGRQERAFLYVQDCVDALLLGMEKIQDAEPINLGGEEIVSIGELATRIAKLSGRDLPLEYDVRGPQGTYRYCADTTRMRNTLGWLPITSLDTGLSRTYEWARRALNVA